MSSRKQPGRAAGEPEAGAAPAAGEALPELAGVVVHWHDEAHLAALAARWPDDPRFELVVVDNGSDERLAERLAELPATKAGRLTLIEPGRNLGFAGGVNAGVRAARAPALLLLNPDAAPEPGALAALLDGLAAHPAAAGLAPRLLGPDGEPQHRWQLRPLPGAAALLAQALLLPTGSGPRREPAAGAPVAQPAAAALVLRRRALAAAGGMDEGFHPAWFEDVDLARRLAAAGERIVYWPPAVFRHRLGASLPRLGYGRFLWIYYRGLARYLAKHHGRTAAAAVRWLLPAAALGRLVLVPLRRPRRAAGRGEAARGLLTLALGAASGWRRPASWALEPAPAATGDETRPSSQPAEPANAPREER